MVFPNSIKPRQKQIKQRKQIQKPKQASKQTNQSKRQDPKANHQREKTMEIPGTSSEQEKVEFSADNIQRTKGGHFGTQLPSFFETSNVWIQTTFQFTREWSNPPAPLGIVGDSKARATIEPAWTVDTQPRLRSKRGLDGHLGFATSSPGGTGTLNKPGVKLVLPIVVADSAPMCICLHHDQNGRGSPEKAEACGVWAHWFLALQVRQF